MFSWYATILLRQYFILRMYFVYKGKALSHLLFSTWNFFILFNFYAFKYQLKGYISYKTLTSQIVSSEAEVKNFFYFVEKLFSVLKIFCIFNHPMIYQVCDIMMSISTWDRVHFWIYLLNHNSLSHQTWSIDWYTQVSNFQEFFNNLGKWG